MPTPDRFPTSTLARSAVSWFMVIGGLLVVSLVVTIVSVAWQIAGITDSNAERLTAQGQLLVAAFQFVVAVALAVLTAWYVKITSGILDANKLLFEESVRARQDARAGRVAILFPLPSAPQWLLGPDYLGEELVRLDREFVLPAEAHRRVTARFEAMLINEGPTSVVVEPSGCAFRFVKGLGGFDPELLDRRDARLPQPLARGQWVLRPGQHALLTVEPAHTVTEWLDSDEGCVDSLTMQVWSQNNPTVVDRWTLTVWARPLEVDDADQGRARPTFQRQPLDDDAVLGVVLDGPARSYLPMSDNT